MCWQAVRAVIEQSRQRGPAYLLLLIIAEKINERSGEWSPSVQELANSARMSTRQVHEHLPRLERANELEITHRAGRRSTYRVTFYTPEDFRTGADSEPMRISAQGGEDFRRGGMRISAQGGEDFRTQTRISSAPPQNHHLNNDVSVNGKKAERRPLVWKSVLDDLGKRYSDQAVKSWAAPAQLWSLGENRWQLRCDTPSQREQIVSRFGESIRVALQSHLGRSVNLEILT